MALKKPDIEMVALCRIENALEPLSLKAQERVLSYATERASERVDAQREATFRAANPPDPQTQTQIDPK